ncbi:MAG: LemA family protein [Candidatus Micrarchaeota archaeon]|nr:LemA family protein [Candidatus Micrarchaeota archaeon]
MIPIILYTVIAIVALAVILIARGWIRIYNKFQYWYNKAEERFANIDVIMQQRIDMLPALAQAIKKYDIHEYKAIKDTIEARSRWTKDAPLSEKVASAQDIENNFLKIQAVFERYPQLKSSKLHAKIMGHGNISSMERRLSKYRLGYNKVVEEYNRRVAIFPRNVVAKVHGFKRLEYLTLGNKINQGEQETYKPRELFSG